MDYLFVQSMAGMAVSIEIILFFLLNSLIAVLCGAISNEIAKSKLIKYRENFYLKFKSNFLFGFILTFLNIFYWFGFILTIYASYYLKLVNSSEITSLISLDFIWYTLIYIISRIGFDRITKEKSSKPPYIEFENPIITNGFGAVFKILKMNLNAPLGKLKHRWAMPSGKFMACYLWDSAFIALLWKYFDSTVAKEILLPLLDHQTVEGRIPHFVSMFNTSDLTQPPLLAWSISNLNVDIMDLKHIYPKLKKYNHWLYQNRRLTNGLFYWKHSYESGIDNSPRFTDRSEKHKSDLTQLAAVDLNSYMILQNRALINIAQKLYAEGKFETFNEDILEFKQKINELSNLIQTFLWDDELGLYLDYDISKRERLKINTIVSFLPLTAGISTESQVKRLIMHLENPEEYNTTIPLPTVALNDNNFEKDTWRGPVWVNTAYLIIKGLEYYGHYQLSTELAIRLIKGIFQTWHREGSFYEFYDPHRFDLTELTRKKGNLYKQITLGGKPVKNFIGWTGLVNSLFIESVIGFDSLNQSLRPRFSNELLGQKIILGIPSMVLELQIEYIDQTKIHIKCVDLSKKEADRTITCSPYQNISLKEFEGLK